MIINYLARRGLRLTLLGEFYLTALGLMAAFMAAWALVWVFS